MASKETKSKSKKSTKSINYLITEDNHFILKDLAHREGHFEGKRVTQDDIINRSLKLYNDTKKERWKKKYPYRAIS